MSEMKNSNAVIIALAVCFVIEVMLWWKLNWSPWAAVAMFVAGCRGSLLACLRSEKDQPTKARGEG